MSEVVSVKQVDLDFSVIDEGEFDIPVVDQAPTLESILSSRDDDCSSVVDSGDESLCRSPALSGHAHYVQDRFDSESVSSKDCDSTTFARQQTSRSVQFTEHGPVIRRVTLKSVSSQIAAAVDRIDCGFASCIAVSSVVAVGTMHGVILVFDPSQTLQWCLGGAAGIGIEFGSVTCLSLNDDCTRLLAGHARGQIIMWDLTTGKTLRTITGVHTPGASVLNVKYTCDRNFALSNDSGGSVFQLEFKRLIGVRSCNAECLFSGSRGQVCCVEPLRLVYSTTAEKFTHLLSNTLVFAMASLSKVSIVSLRPELKVHFSHVLTGNSATFPLLSWHFVSIKTSSTERVVDPVLLFARDCSVFFVQVSLADGGNIEVKMLQETTVPYSLLSVAWFDSRTLIHIDITELVHVIDVRSENELELVDLADLNLSYSATFYKSKVTNNNVSSPIGQSPCYQSVVSFRGQIFLLGSLSVQVLNRRTWSERLDLLVAQSKYSEALALSRAFRDGKASSTLGLSGYKGKTRRDLMADRIAVLLIDYIDHTLSRLATANLNDKKSDAEVIFQSVITECIENCLLINNSSMLFETIFDKLSVCGLAKSTFLECLEPYILNGRLKSVSPDVIKEFVDHYEQRGALAAVEACIIHLDIASLDIHQVVSLCWARNLYDAILYVYNCGMKDYITPLQQLLAVLKTAVDNNSANRLEFHQTQLGNKILVYISCCLAGRAYPLGDIPVELVDQVRNDVINFITSPSICVPLPNVNGQLTYPHIWTLLSFDTRELFNVLSLAFEDPAISSSQKQLIVDILLQVMTNNQEFSASQVGMLFTFLARQLARTNNAVGIDGGLFEQLLTSLCSSSPAYSVGEEPANHEERQQALLELLATPSMQKFDSQRLLTLARSAKFHRVAELVHLRHRDFDKALTCYFLDAMPNATVFDFVLQLNGDKSLTDREIERFKEAFIELFDKFVEIDSRRAAKLAVITLRIPVKRLFSKLNDRGETKALYSFLNTMFDTYCELLENPDSFPDLDRDICERYVDLLCQYAPSSTDVIKFLKAYTGYRNEVVLETCRKHGTNEAIIYLLEKSGNVPVAFRLALHSLRLKLDSVIAAKLSKGNSSLDSKMAVLENALDGIIGLLCRHSADIDQSVREELWFALIDFLVEEFEQVNSLKLGQDTNGYLAGDSCGSPVSNSNFSWLTMMIKSVLNAMVWHIPFVSVIEHVVAISRNDTDGRNRSFGNFHDVLFGIIETCQYERETFTACSRVVRHDLHNLLAQLATTVSRAVAPKSALCAACMCQLASSPAVASEADISSSVCFQCGHVYHRRCLQQAIENLDCRSRSKFPSRAMAKEPNKKWQCLVCSDEKTHWRNQYSVVGTRVQVSTSPRVPSTLSSFASDELCLNAARELRLHQKTSSRLKMLSQLQQFQDDEVRGSSKTTTAFPPKQSSFSELNPLLSERLALKLVPPSTSSSGPR